MIDGDLLDSGSLFRAVELAAPDEVYHLAAQSFVGASFDQPELTANVTGLGTVRMIEAVRRCAPHARFYQASSSEMFGDAPHSPQRENTPFRPRSPYGAAKVFAHHSAVNAREAHGMWVSCGILFNHEGPRRGIEFVTRRISHAVARIKFGLDSELTLGNLDARRDWGSATDYVEAMWLMMQADEPSDWVVATGESHSVREFCEVAFAYAGLNWTDHVRVDPDRRRPTDITGLIGDATRIEAELGWVRKTSFKSLVEQMVDADLARIAQNLGKG